MIVNISPADYNMEETLSSLYYASHVKLISNDAHKTIESKELTRMKDKIKELSEENESLKKIVQKSDILMKENKI